MHGPTRIFWANLTAFSLEAAVEVQHLRAHDEELADLKWEIDGGTAAAPQGDAARLRAENEQLRTQLAEQVVYVPSRRPCLHLA
jgi:hypothetical protein